MPSYPKNIRAKSLNLPQTGFIVPRVSNADISILANISSVPGAPIAGSILYNTNTGKLMVYNGSNFETVSSS